jgi:hypothetical protein
MSKTADADLIARLEKDPRFFIETFLYVVDKERKKVPFLFNPMQERYYKERTLADIILKARKEGFSTEIEALFLHACIFNDNTNAITMAHTLDDTVIHMDRVKYFLDTMGLNDVRVKVGLEKDNQREIYFPHSHSRYWIGTAGSRAFGRGRDVTHAHLSEAAFYGSEEAVTSVLEACVPGAHKVIETTANGVGGFFHRMVVEATQPDYQGPWKFHFFAWFEDPTNVADVPMGISWRPEELAMQKRYRLTERQLAWYRKKHDGMVDKSKMPQEHPSNAREAFLASGKCIFDAAGLEAQETTIREPKWRGVLQDAGEFPEFVPDPSGRLLVWDVPDDRRRYFIAADVAKGGDKGDSSVALVFDRDSWTLAAKWHGKIEPMEFGRILFGLGTYYNTAKIAVEVWPGPGGTTGAKLVELRYPRLYRQTVLNNGERESGEEYGWETTSATRPDAVAHLQDAIRKKRLTLRDRSLVDEFYNFVRNKSGKPEARAGCHDDQVMAAAIAVHAMTYDPVAREIEGDLEPAVIVTGGVSLPGRTRQQMVSRARSRGGALAGFR